MVGVKMGPEEITLLKARDARRKDGGSGPALRSALQQVEALLAWAEDDLELTPRLRARLGMFLDEDGPVADAVLEVLLGEQLEATNQADVAGALALAEADLAPALLLLEQEGLIRRRDAWIVPLEPSGAGPGASRLLRLGLTPEG